MPFTIETIPVESVFGVTIRNKLLLNAAKSGHLLVLLPGRGYTNDHPVMHYLTHAALARGYDVLRVEYGFQVANQSLAAVPPEKMPLLMQESQRAIEQTLERGGYTRICLAAKSMGTPLAVSIQPELNVTQKSLLLLTAIQNAAAMTGGIRTLAINGAITRCKVLV